MLHAPANTWAHLADKRRKTFDYQTSLVFPEVFVGPAEPSIPESRNTTDDKWLRGKPVSRGRVEGPARVVSNVTEALEVQPGEILIAPVTDVGWTPCFGVIAGVATEVGSAVSHGAVVAREYGLPALVNVHGATHHFKTGELVVLDAERGFLYRKADETFGE